MTRSMFVLFAVIAYVIFFVAFLYLIGFVGGFPLMPTSVDMGMASSAGAALLIDIMLILAFGLQHSVMARQGFKSMWTRIVPEPIERSVYVLSASLILIMLMALWRPIPSPVLWDMETGIVSALLWGLFAVGWMMVLLSTFLINHFDLFGLAQVYRNWRGKAAAEPRFRQPLFYKLVRHPLYLGFLLAFWATPHMTAGHLLLAVGMSTYILIAIQYEERDLVRLFGRDYQEYQKKVGMLFPRMGRTSALTDG